ncbi:MAG: porin family protein [Geobacteraceae bacterium]|nr:porin family protein [Geobacteraceae bacterium]
MKRVIFFLVMLAATGFTCNPVNAAEHYISGMGGISWANKLHLVDTYQYEMFNDYQDYALGTGFNVLGAIGCDYGSFRLEGEVGYQTSDVKTAINGEDGVPYQHPLDEAGNNFSSDPWDMKGEVSVLSLMANGYYDFKLGKNIELYATAGIGVARVSLKDVHEVTTIEGDGNGGYIFYPNTNPGYSNTVETTAWQLGAGIAVPVSGKIKLDLRYRYFATSDFTVPGVGSYYYANISGGSKDSRTNFSSQSVLLGLRVGI